MGGLRQPHGPPPAHAGFGDGLRVDWLTSKDLEDRLPGRLGLTFLPGKRGVSTRYPGNRYTRDTAADLAMLREQGVVRLVLLVEDEELDRWGDREIVALGEAAGVEVRRHPIPDGAPPESLDAMDRILADVAKGRARGDVAVACMGGVGRTGTVAACALVRAGLSANQSISRIRAVRHPTAVETPAQEAFVEAYAAHAGQAPRAAKGPDVGR